MDPDSTIRRISVLEASALVFGVTLAVLLELVFVVIVVEAWLDPIVGLAEGPLPTALALLYLALLATTCAMWIRVGWFAVRSARGLAAPPLITQAVGWGLAVVIGVPGLALVITADIPIIERITMVPFVLLFLAAAPLAGRRLERNWKTSRRASVAIDAMMEARGQAGESQQQSAMPAQDDRTATDMIQSCRRIFGSPPRDLGRIGWPGLRTRRPLWSRLSFWDPIKTHFGYLERTFAQGHVVWAHVVQANELMFEPGSQDCPGEVVFSFDTSLDGQTERLEELAGQLFDLKGTHPSDPALRQIANRLANEMRRDYGAVVPKLLAGGTQYRTSVIFFDRRHLPGEHLMNSRLPVIVHPRPPHVVTVLPQEFWDPEFRDWWVS